MPTPNPQDPPTTTEPHNPPNEQPTNYPQPTVTVPSVTELLNSLDAARTAFEQATHTSTLRHQIEGYAARLHLAQQALAQERRNHAGLSQGETDRLRRVEAAMVDLGAPNHSTHDDPGGPMIAWIQKVATERVQLRAELEDLTAELSRLVQALRRWLTAGKPVADWQMVHLVDQLSDQVGKWFDAATEKGETQMLGHAEVLDALKPRKGPGGDG